MPIRPRKTLTPKKKTTALTLAQKAVNEFEVERSRLFEMKQEFQEQFPDAHEFLQEILRQEDLIADKIKLAIPLVRDAKQDVGGFKCQTKRSSPHYDDAEFSQLVTEIEEGGAILIELLEGGYVKKLSLDPSAAAYFSQHPEAAAHFESSWREAEDMTPAVTAPKI
jgi:hypothetical protein